MVAGQTMIFCRCTPQFLVKPCETSNVHQCPDKIAMFHAEMSIKFSDRTQVLAVESLMFPMFPDQNISNLSFCC